HRMTRADIAMPFTTGLRIPEPQARPGAAPDFSSLVLPQAGAARRPAVDDHPGLFRELAYDLIRVLDEEGNAVGPWAPSLDPKALLGALRH
ncbi:hypothetical protein ABI077_15280, partial [Enterococcus faecium]|uniref:hypothetical protein n=1 Tax=Enterococcus faecium TaxID=1352 RepID=UPI003F425C5F